MKILSVLQLLTTILEKWFCGDCLNEAYEGVDDKVVDEDEEDDGDKEDDSDYNLRCQAKNLREGNTHSSRGGKRKLEPEAKGKQSESEPEGKRQKLEPTLKQYIFAADNYSHKKIPVRLFNRPRPILHAQVSRTGGTNDLPYHEGSLRIREPGAQRSKISRGQQAAYAAA